MDEYITKKLNNKLNTEYITDEIIDEKNLLKQFEKVEEVYESNNTESEKIIEEENFIEKPDKKEHKTKEGKELVASETGSEVAVFTEKTPEPVIRDQEYIIGETHLNISKISEVLGVLGDTLQDGSRASEFEAFGNVSKALTDNLKFLSDFHFKIKDQERMQEEIAPPQNVTNNLVLSGADMLDKILELKEQANKSKEIKQDG